MDGERVGVAFSRSECGAAILRINAAEQLVTEIPDGAQSRRRIIDREIDGIRPEAAGCRAVGGIGAVEDRPGHGGLATDRATRRGDNGIDLEIGGGWQIDQHRHWRRAVVVVLARFVDASFHFVGFREICHHDDVVGCLWKTRQAERLRYLIALASQQHAFVRDLPQVVIRAGIEHPVSGEIDAVIPGALTIRDIALAGVGNHEGGFERRATQHPRRRHHFGHAQVR